MSETESPQTVSALPRILVSYDVRARRRSECSQVQQYVAGRTVVKETTGGTRRYHYPGLVSKDGVERVGQSVLMMREPEAERFAAFLARLRVPYRQERIWVEG